jgi:MoxR-like ATPase
MAIIKKRLPGIEQELLKQVVNFVQELRKRKLSKTPGVSETMDWAESLMALGYKEINARAFEQTLGAVLKSSEDIQQVKQEGIKAFID